MKCQNCQAEPAQVHVTELADEPPQPMGEGQLPVWAFEEQHLCEACAQESGVPFTQIKKTQLEIWKLLHATAQRQRRESSLSCPDCGMTLAEFREKGRLGCPRDYEIFRDHLDRLLERVHNSDRHTGRLPGGERVERPAPSPQADSDLPSLESTDPAEAPRAPQEPISAPAEPTPADDRARLSAELEQAIQDEDYERAAELRDALKALES